ncbi:MAG: FtsW/RodA/SpoVE family cell cycle protein [Thermoleophilaceae bacterium]
MRARNRELLGLIPAALLVTAGFASVLSAQNPHTPSKVSMTYGAIFLGLCLVAHIAIRRVLPHADPYLLPLVTVLASVGIVEIYRIKESLARNQAVWFLVGIAVFVLTISFLRDLERLERYRYTIAVAAVGAMLLPRLPGVGGQVNGAYLAIRTPLGGFQPAEFAKVAIVVFLASYLHDRRELMVQEARRILGVTLPPLKYFGPLLVIWGAAMGMLLITRELGTSLMFFGALLAILYVATSRLSFVTVGIALFAVGAWFVGAHTAHVRDRVAIWLHPFRPDLVNGKGYQIAQSVFAQADGGLFGRGIGRSLLQLQQGGTIIPVPESDLIYSVITNELGLAGAAGLLLVYLLVIARGLKIAQLAREPFPKLLALGLTFVIALQVFVIVGGVTRVIPLTGVTLPFVSYGGSSVVANFVLVGLLLVVSERARHQRPGISPVVVGSGSLSPEPAGT